MAALAVISSGRSLSGRCCGLRRRVSLRRGRRALTRHRRRPLARAAKLPAWPVFHHAQWSSRSTGTEERGSAAAAAFLARVGVSIHENSHEEEQPFSQLGDAATSAGRAAGDFSLHYVRFTSYEDEVHEIVPYAEVYGLHPREFVFGKNFCLIPATGPFGFVGMGEESQDSDEAHDEANYSDDEDDFEF